MGDFYLLYTIFILRIAEVENVSFPVVSALDDFWLVNAFLEGTEMSRHAWLLILKVTMSPPFFFPCTAVLNMDNTIVDLETLQALYENVSIKVFSS